MMFIELDHGVILRKESGLDAQKIMRLVIGNPMIMKKWLNVFLMLDHMRGLQFWSTNGAPTAARKQA